MINQRCSTTRAAVGSMCCVRRHCEGGGERGVREDDEGVIGGRVIEGTLVRECKIRGKMGRTHRCRNVVEKVQVGG